MRTPLPWEGADELYLCGTNSEMASLIIVLTGIAVMWGIIVMAYRSFRRKKKQVVSLPQGYKEILTRHVGFYRALDADGRARFEKRLEVLMGDIRIHGVKIDIDAVDRLLVAASGVIPTFGFPEWKYNNLTDVLLYGEAFDTDHFASEGNRQDVIGVVGSGALERVMILSKPALHQGFAHIAGKENTGIHEFVHLLDKADGAVDGLPEALLARQDIAPWLHLLTKNIHDIQAGHSDINTYAAKNPAEFFAVTAEYFFKRPDQFRQTHPDLYPVMVQIFQQEPGVDPLLHQDDIHPA